MDRTKHSRKFSSIRTGCYNRCNRYKGTKKWRWWWTVGNSDRNDALIAFILDRETPGIGGFNKFNEKYNLAHCIGVHIRYTDNLTDDSKNVYNFNTNFDSFLSRINEFEKTTILICSDNNDILNFFKNYKETTNTFIFADQCEIPEKEKQVFFQPFYEMMLLSNTSKIIGSASSTFSYEAAFFNGTDIELYEREYDITNDINSLSPSNKFVWKTYHLSEYK